MSKKEGRGMVAMAGENGKEHGAGCGAHHTDTEARGHVSTSGSDGSSWEHRGRT